jgi:putative radical SAM enzyme (TIGR03279 family)
MEAVIAEVYPDGIAQRLGLAPGDKVLRINGLAPADLIEWQWEWACEEVRLEVCQKASDYVGSNSFEIRKGYDEGFGVQFEAPVFDGIRPCSNRCVFCFVDQMPPGCRESLYIKDDDYRLSFLQGSYITLTNLTDADIGRIEAEKLSPLYVSVHATDPAVRAKMLGRSVTDRLMEMLDRLGAAGIAFHSQVVLCPGINDGAVLERTIEDLSRIDAAISVAVVPVGLTGHRQGLPALRPVGSEEAEALIRWLGPVQARCLKEKGTRFVWLSDEFYTLAGQDVPDAETYEGYPQWENGVGLVRSLLDEAAEYGLPEAVEEGEPLLLAGGIAAMKALASLWERLKAVKGLDVRLLPLENRFFGAMVTASGLLTGKCLVEGLGSLELPAGVAVYLPDVMLKDRQSCFLDGMTASEAASRLGRELVFLPQDGYGILAKLMESRVVLEEKKL